MYWENECISCSVAWKSRELAAKGGTPRDRRSQSVPCPVPSALPGAGKGRFQLRQRCGQSITASAAQHRARSTAHQRATAAGMHQENHRSFWWQEHNIGLPQLKKLLPRSWRQRLVFPPKLIRFTILSIPIFIFNLCQGFATVFTATHFDILWLSMKFIPSRQPTQTAFTVFFFLVLHLLSHSYLKKSCCNSSHYCKAVSH